MGYHPTSWLKSLQQLPVTASGLTSILFSLSSKAIADLIQPPSLTHVLISGVCQSPPTFCFSNKPVCTHLRAFAGIVFTAWQRASSCSPKSALSTVMALQSGSAGLHFPASLAVGKTLLPSSPQHGMNRNNMIHF